MVKFVKKKIRKLQNCWKFSKIEYYKTDFSDKVRHHKVFLRRDRTAGSRGLVRGGDGGVSRRACGQSGDSSRVDCDGCCGAATVRSDFSRRQEAATAHQRLPARHCHPLHFEHEPLSTWAPFFGNYVTRALLLFMNIVDR